MKNRISYFFNCVFLFLFFSLNFSSVAQNKSFAINSGEIMKKGIELHEAEKYKQAIEQFDQIPLNDTNYLWAMYEKSLSARVDSQYRYALNTSLTALKVKPNSYEHDLLIQIGSIYDDMEKFDSAAMYFDKAIKKFPNSYLTYHSKGINQYLKKNYDSAFANFQTAILMNPYSNNSHYFLGVIAMDRGYPIHSMMSFAMSLMIAPGSARANTIIKFMYQISQLSDKMLENMNNRKEEKFIQEDYSDLETYFKAKLALDKKYSIQTKLDEPLFRQLNLIFEKMPSSIQHSNDIWSAFYAPIYRKVYDDKFFNAVCMIMVSGLQNESIQKMVKDNKKEMEKVADEITERLDEIGYYRSFDKATYKDVPGYWFADSRPVSKGSVLNKDKKLTDGEWVYFNKVGDIIKVINYKAGKYQGTYKTFTNDGLLSSVGEFVDDKLVGEVKEFYDEGSLKTKSIIRDGKREGLFEEYYANGAPSMTSNYVAGKKNGPATIYYESGCKHYEVTYKDDLLEGIVKEFFKDGSLFSVTEITKDKAEGSKKEYFPGGQKQTEGTMHDGMREGAFTSYFTNGNIASKENYKKGKLDGSCTYYHKNGKERLVITYDAGEQDGESTSKDDEGRLVLVDEYKKGHLKRIKYYNVLTGQVVKENVIDDKDKNSIIVYNSIGNKTMEAVCTRDGVYNGEYKEYYPDGKVELQKQYEKGDANGKATEYFKTGKVYREENYKNDKLDGSYKQYYVNGTIDLEGSYIDGEREGYWYNYDNLGTLVSKDYYLHNKREGICTTYFPSGKLKGELYHQNGHETRYIEYDTTGKVLQDLSYTIGKSFQLVQHNGIGIKRRVANVLYNNLVDKDIEYFPNGKIGSETYYKFGMLDSNYISYYTNGNKNRVGAYLNDEKTGTWKIYDRDGTLLAIEHFEFGEEVGTDSIFSEKNTVETTIDYKGGERHGWLKQFGLSNEIMYQCHYINGLMVGYTYEAPDGSLVKEIPVENSDKIVQINTFYKNGKRSLESGYQNGHYEGKRILYFPNEKVYYEANYKEGYLEGDEKEFYSNGQLSYKRHYTQGEYDGINLKYNQNGLLIREENYYKGYLHGTTKIYDNNGKILQTITYYWGEILSID